MGLTDRLPDDGALPVNPAGPDALLPDATGGVPASPAARLGLGGLLSGITGVLLVVWFFIAWLGLDRPAADAAGESVGTAFALLLVVSAVGAFRGRER